MFEKMYYQSKLRDNVSVFKFRDYAINTRDRGPGMFFDNLYESELDLCSDDRRYFHTFVRQTLLKLHNNNIQSYT